jgi:hypothetical protein
MCRIKARLLLMSAIETGRFQLSAGFAPERALTLPSALQPSALSSGGLTFLRR